MARRFVLCCQVFSERESCRLLRVFINDACLLSGARVRGCSMSRSHAEVMHGGSLKHCSTWIGEARKQRREEGRLEGGEE